MTVPIRSEARKAASEYAFSNAEFDAISKFAYENFGLNLSESKKPLVHSRLARRFRDLKIRGFEEYWKLLSRPDDQQERQHLLSALTTNVTHFFRENHHFDILKKNVLPKLVDRARDGGRVRLWSAGCSTGPEPYSIAMTLLDLCPEANRLDIKILGTDIDPEVIRKARVAEYPCQEIKSLPDNFAQQFIEQSSQGEATMVICRKVRSMVSFGVLNLIEELPFKGPFDVIFCRNVAIYFDESTQGKVWNTLGNVLAEGGHLFIGHSERLSGAASKDFEPAGITAHVKKSNNLTRGN